MKLHKVMMHTTNIKHLVEWLIDHNHLAFEVKSIQEFHYWNGSIGYELHTSPIPVEDMNWSLS